MALLSELECLQIELRKDSYMHIDDAKKYRRSMEYFEQEYKIMYQFLTKKFSPTRTPFSLADKFCWL